MSGRGMAIGGGGIGLLLLVVAALLCGVDPTQLIQNMPTQQQVEQPQTASNSTAVPDEQSQFARAVLGSTEDVWRRILPQQAGVNYREPKLVLFSGQVRSACGFASAATGPFYCPGDNQLYLDFSFFQELKTQFGASGDFAEAYVIAHEVGHHVQNLLGTMSQVQRAGNDNRLSVALELQADCYAGVWAYYAAQANLVEEGDAEEAIRAAGSVGDDAIQRRTTGYVRPDSFTHGSAQQRMEYFARGMRSGDMRQCQTFR